MEARKHRLSTSGKDLETEGLLKYTRSDKVIPNVSQLGRFKCFINGQLAIDNCRANNSECRNTFAEKAT